MLKHIIALCCAVTLCACSTVAGIGKDIQSGASAVQNSVK